MGNPYAVDEWHSGAIVIDKNALKNPAMAETDAFMLKTIAKIQGDRAHV